MTEAPPRPLLLDDVPLWHSQFHPATPSSPPDPEAQDRGPLVLGRGFPLALPRAASVGTPRPPDGVPDATAFFSLAEAVAGMPSGLGFWNAGGTEFLMQRTVLDVRRNGDEPELVIAFGASLVF
jgi:hypothetical protein